jgi:hypothetical protein
MHASLHIQDGRVFRRIVLCRILSSVLDQKDHGSENRDVGSVCCYKDASSSEFDYVRLDMNHLRANLSTYSDGKCTL